VSQHLYSQAGAQAGQPGTLEKERRTCLSFLIFGKSNQPAALSPNLFFTAKDAEEAKERPAKSISVGIHATYTACYCVSWFTVSRSRVTVPERITLSQARQVLTIAMLRTRGTKGAAQLLLSATRYPSGL
jgi:hypothetical protein